jgi:hypothetical protein
MSDSGASSLELLRSVIEQQQKSLRVLTREGFFAHPRCQLPRRSRRLERNQCRSPSDFSTSARRLPFQSRRISRRRKPENQARSIAPRTVVDIALPGRRLGVGRLIGHSQHSVAPLLHSDPAAALTCEKIREVEIHLTPPPSPMTA